MKPVHAWMQPLLDSPLEAVFFDLDETIFEFRRSSRAGLKAVIAGVPRLSDIGEEALENRYWELGRETLQLVRSGIIGIECENEHRFKKMFELHGLSLPEDQLASLLNLYASEFSKESWAVPGTREILGRVRRSGLKVGIITNGPKKSQIRTVERLGLNPLIDFMITPEDAGTLKPDSRIFVKATDTAGVAPEHSVMIGDSWTNDIVGANSASIRSIWFNRKGELQPGSEATASITSLWELPELLGLQDALSLTPDALRNSDSR